MNLCVRRPAQGRCGFARTAWVSAPTGKAAHKEAEQLTIVCCSKITLIQGYIACALDKPCEGR